MTDNFDSIIEEKKGKSAMLNLGCGSNYHPDWVNVDFLSLGKEVISYDLTKGVPFSSGVFDVVYHSHVLEHFTAQQGDAFIKECFRVLKPGGVLRIAVPDLEGIVRNYLHFFELALENGEGAVKKYEWMKLELYDQTTRNIPAGEYQNFLRGADDELKKFAQQRLGRELNAMQLTENSSVLERLKRKTPGEYFRYLRVKTIKLIAYCIGGQRMAKALDIGLFRLSGEIHQCMYDRLSLTNLLRDNGFDRVEVVGAFDSNIANFASYKLDTFDGGVRKPDSLFMEAYKK